MICPVIKGRASIPPTWSCNGFNDGVIWELAREKPKDKPTNPGPTTYFCAFGSISGYGSSISCWKKPRFFSALIVPCVHWDTKKSEARKMLEGKGQERKRSGKGYEGKDASSSQLCPRARPHTGSFLGSTAQAGQRIRALCVYHPPDPAAHSPQIPPPSPRPPSLLFGSFSLCP